MSKPITAAAVMILMEQGQIDLFDPVSQYLPGFKNQKVMENDKSVAVKREMSILDLLDMSSGLLYPEESPSGRFFAEVFDEIEKKLLSEAPLSTLEIADKLGTLPLAFHPGSDWDYGTSADILGAIIETISGIPFGEFLSREIFIPLGMIDTAFYVPEEKQSRLAKTYETTDQKELKLYTGNNLGIINSMKIPPAFESGGAGLASTIDDYYRFASCLLNKGTGNGIQLLSPKTIQFMTTHQLNESLLTSFREWYNLAGFSYGNLMRIMHRPELAGGLACQGEYGWDGWLGCYFANLPEEKITLLIMMQKKDAGTIPLTRKLRNIIISSFD